MLEEYPIDPEYDIWIEWQNSHSTCSYTECVLKEGKECPQYWELDCYACTGFYPNPPVKRQVVALGPVLEKQRDPTQSYKLECGHYAI